LSAFSKYKRINSNKYNKQTWIWKKREKVIGTGWKYQPVPKGLPPYVSVAASLVPAGLSNRYQWKPKAPVEKPGVLRRGHWSRLRGTGWKTGSFGPSQPVLKACFLVVRSTLYNGSMATFRERK